MKTTLSNNSNKSNINEAKNNSNIQVFGPYEGSHSQKNLSEKKGELDI